MRTGTAPPSMPTLAVTHRTSVAPQLTDVGSPLGPTLPSPEQFWLPVSSLSSQLRMNTPTTSYPCCCSSMAATAESTPPLMPTATRRPRPGGTPCGCACGCCAAAPAAAAAVLSQAAGWAAIALSAARPQVGAAQLCSCRSRPQAAATVTDAPAAPPGKMPLLLTAVPLASEAARALPPLPPRW